MSKSACAVRSSLAHRASFPQTGVFFKFARDRRRWVHWLYEARRRYGLSVLNYTVTSNHEHLLVRDRSKQEIMASMQLAAGCVAREYNRRKRRKGAFLGRSLS